MSSRLVFECVTSGGTKTFSYNYASPTVSNATVRALGNGLITYGSIFENVPTSIRAAKLITTTTTAFDLS